MDAKKFKKLTLKDFAQDPGSRLQSIRLPRDLTLGGTKSSRKVFKPNVNVVRNKNKIENTSKEITKPKNQQQDKYQDKFKHRFVQSSGVFSEGAAQGVKVSANRGYARDSAEPSVPSIPRIKKNLDIDKAHEDNVLDGIVRSNDNSDSDSDDKSSFAPVVWESAQPSIKGEIKSEPDSEQHLPLEYTDSVNSLTLWQLPDSFAYKNESASSTKATRSEDCTLSDMPGGEIGKVCIRKSGKVEVVVGNVKYELEPMELETFSEELVVLDKCNASVLGAISRRFILSPDWESLFT